MLESLQAFEPGTARAQKQPQSWPPKLPRGGFCVVVRADPESIDEARLVSAPEALLGGIPGGRSPPGTP
eukprot:9627325-Alexandrium_andersonii.AAC.1